MLDVYAYVLLSILIESAQKKKKKVPAFFFSLIAHILLCSHWPTFPQIFIRGEFIGGSDIILNLHQVCYKLADCSLFILSEMGLH